MEHIEGLDVGREQKLELDSVQLLQSTWSCPPQCDRLPLNWLCLELRNNPEAGLSGLSFSIDKDVSSSSKTNIVH